MSRPCGTPSWLATRPCSTTCSAKRTAAGRPITVRGSGRFADAHKWVIASFAQHTSRDNDPQLYVHNAILNRVLRDDPLAPRPGDQRASRRLDGTALYAAKPGVGTIAERTLTEYLTGRLCGRALGAAGRDGWNSRISEALCEEFSPRRRAIEPRLKELIGAYERKHPKAPNACALRSMTQLVTLDSQRVKAHSAPTRAALLARWRRASGHVPAGRQRALRARL